MPRPEKVESLLVADVGSVHTRVGLVDRVAGEFRFVGMGISPTTMEPPTVDVMLGVRRAIQQLEARIHRQLLSEEGELVTPERADGQGVDAFAAVTSAPLPLRVAVIGLSREVSVAAAVCAVRGTYTTIEATLALDETGGRWIGTTTTSTNNKDHQGPSVGGAPPTNGASSPKSSTTIAPATDPAVIAAETLAHVDCEVIVLVGGVDGGATNALYELANLVAAISAARDTAVRPIVVFAGNRDARSQIATRIGQVATLRIVDNVHPALDRENPAPLARELEGLYIERKLARLPGLGKVNNWAKAPVIPTARAFEYLVRFLSRERECSIIGADIGATSTVVVHASGDEFTRVVDSELGVGYSLGRMLRRVGSQPFLDWLPLESTDEEFRTRYLNQALRPGTIPVTREEARILHAAARQALGTAARDAEIDGGKADWIVLTGGMFSFNSDYGALALVALDALQPRGVVRLAVDTTGLAPAFGALAALDPNAAASVIGRDAFVSLGTVVAPESGGREGQVDLHVRLQPPGSGEISLEVNHGTLEVVPLTAGQKAPLQIRTAKGVELRHARNGLFQGEAEGGALGLVIDARGRPLELPEEPQRRRDKVQQWYWDVGS